MKNLLPVVGRKDLVLTHGSGAYVYSENGDKYLDFVSGVASNPFGYGDLELENVAINQIKKINHVSVNFRTKELESAAEKLIKLTKIQGKTYFLNSGTEAVEMAIKVIRRYFYCKGRPEKHEIICFKKSFHGRTMGSLSAQGNEKYLEGFDPRCPGFLHADLNDIDSVLELISDKTAGILIETIQGEGGILPCEIGFLRTIREICDQKGIILAIDEVQCGLSRTGKFSAYEWYDIIPDIVTHAKALGGGIAAIGSCTVKEEFGKFMTTGTHGATFGGNAFASGIASYVLDRISCDKFLEKVCESGLLLRDGLENLMLKYPNLILEIRGIGLILGIRLNEKFVINNDFIDKARELEKLLLIVSSKDNVVRVLPRLNVTKLEIEDFCQRLERVLIS